MHEKLTANLALLAVQLASATLEFLREKGIASQEEVDAVMERAAAAAGATTAYSDKMFPPSEH